MSSADRRRAALGGRSRTQGRRRSNGAQASGLKWGLLAGAAALIAVGVVIVVMLESGGGTESAPGSAPPADASATGELSRLNTPDFHSMAISPADANMVLFGHHGGILLSTDGGRSWQQTNLTSDTDDAMGMGIPVADPSIGYAAGHDTFFKSIDGGRTWKSIEPDLPGLDIHGMAVAPDDANRLYANVVRYGFFRSDDGGETWTATGGASYPQGVIQVAAAPGGRVYVASVSSGVLRSDDDGANFKPTGQLEGQTLAVAASGTDSDIVYAGTDTGLFASIDGGATWTRREIPGGGQVMAAAVNPGDPADVVVVAVQSDRAGHVFRSRDGGDTWGG